MSQLSSSAHQSNMLSPELEAAMASRPFPEMPEDYVSHRHARAAHLARLRHLMPVPSPIPSQVTERELLISSSLDNHQIRTIHYYPATPPSTPSPIIILYHEGGWGMGDTTDEEFNARLFVRDLGAVVLNVEYRLIPEHPFPIGITDCWDVLHYAATNASTLHADATKGLIVGGSSAGGNIAAVLSHLSVSRSLSPPVTGAWLSVPYLLPSSQIPEKYKSDFQSMTKNIHDPVLKGGIPPEAEFALISQANFDVSSPLFSVLAPKTYPPSTSSDLNVLPKFFIQVAGLDPLYDHGVLCDRILREEYGAQTRVRRYDGVGHMFWTNWPEMDVSRDFTRDMVDGFRWLLD